MIQLFNTINHKVDTREFSNLLHDPIRGRLEDSIAEYVGAKYAVAVSSCTAAIFLSLKSLGERVVATVPSLSTTRFMGAIVQSGNDYLFSDDVNWVGSEYYLYKKERGTSIIDSAQKLKENQYKSYRSGDLLLFSFYPTKPCGGLKGGMIVSNNKEKIDWIRQASTFGENFSIDSWKSESKFQGYQMYMNSVEASFAMKSFSNYDKRLQKLELIRHQYTQNIEPQLIVTMDSDHLYRIRVDDNEKFIKYMLGNGVICGVHYKPAHKDKAYGSGGKYPKSERDGKEVVSIPFHDGLKPQDVKYIIKLIQNYEFA